MAIIQIKNLTFGYDRSSENIFENVSLNIDTDWKLGLVGRNGRGKTTLLNLLLGKYEYSGKIESSSNFCYFPYAVPNENQLVLDVISDICPEISLWKVKKEINLLDLNEEILYKYFAILSNGEKTKILLALLFLRENSFFLIDEPTNHLDSVGRKILGEYLKNKKGFILVSHDRNLLDICSDHILSINRNDIEIQKGNYSSWNNNKENQDNFEIEKNERLKKEIKRLDESAKQTSVWSSRTESEKYGNGPVDKGYIGHKAAKMMKSAKNIEKRYEKQIEEKKELLKNIDYIPRLKMEYIPFNKENLINIKNLSVSYENIIFENISFEVNRGDRIIIEGKNGSGKSSLIKLILGEDISYKGVVNVSPSLKISYISQDTSFLSGSAYEYAEEEKINETLFFTILRKLNLSEKDFSTDMKELSSGQKKKILLAKSLSSETNLYVWDEPLNFIDIFSRKQIEDAILEFSPTMIFVEHDRQFAEKIANKNVFLY